MTCTEHILTYLLTIHLFSLEKCLFRSLALFLIELLFYITEDYFYMNILKIQLSFA